MYAQQDAALLHVNAHTQMGGEDEEERRERRKKEREEKRGRGMFVCTCVGRKGCPCWLFMAPPLFMFGNLRNRVKEGGERQRGRMETGRGKGITLHARAARSVT